jgi:hypothetical protein
MSPERHSDSLRPRREASDRHYLAFVAAEARRLAHPDRMLRRTAGTTAREPRVETMSRPTILTYASAEGQG